MNTFDIYAQNRLIQKAQKDSVRYLKFAKGADFTSNDYLGLSKSPQLMDKFREKISVLTQMGSTGSRLLTGNHSYHEEVEEKIAGQFKAETSLLFSSGYILNIGLIQCLADEESVIIMDELTHNSQKNGARLSKGKTLVFRHNDMEHLEERLKAQPGNRCFIVVESVYSMDGDLCPLKEVVELSKRYGAEVIVDEAHGIGTIGEQGLGLTVELGLQDEVLARVITFGKALGVEGAAVLGKENLKQYLVNFCQSFIYTTGISYPLLAMIDSAVELIAQSQDQIQRLHQNMKCFSEASGRQMTSPICSWRIDDTALVKEVCCKINEDGFSVFPIVAPTVKRGTERIRLVLHASNSPEEIIGLVSSIRRHHVSE